MKGDKAIQDIHSKIIRDRTGIPTLSSSTSGKDPRLPDNNVQNINAQSSLLAAYRVMKQLSLWQSASITRLVCGPKAVRH